jgi:MoxR-like ATPase
MTDTPLSEILDPIRDEVTRVIRGQDSVVDHLLIAMLVGGHVLLEGTPGLGKTLLVRTLAHVSGCQFGRIQFTPDLMPTDVTGGSMYRENTGTFDFVPGPVFANLLLADEINRATPKTQSALLEAMQEGNVTSDGITHALPRPFVVLATQNPLESQGTYPLPDAQLDRFLFKLRMTTLSKDDERQMVQAHLDGFDGHRLELLQLRKLANASMWLGLRERVAEVRFDAALLDYVLAIVHATRAHRSLLSGASPRATIALAQSARAAAALDGRAFVVPDDIKSLAPAVLRHRVVLEPEVEFEGMSADDCLENILSSVPAPALS